MYLQWTFGGFEIQPLELGYDSDHKGNNST